MLDYKLKHQIDDLRRKSRKYLSKELLNNEHELAIHSTEAFSITREMAKRDLSKSPSDLSIYLHFRANIFNRFNQHVISASNESYDSCTYFRVESDGVRDN